MSKQDERVAERCGACSTCGHIATGLVDNDMSNLFYISHAGALTSVANLY